MEKRIILVTNDDGIEADGIRELVKSLGSFADVYVTAPAEQQSAKSHGITFLRTVCVEEQEMEGAVKAYAVDGTPVDCVKVGLAILGEKGIKPDYVFSGINMGLNTGLAAYYSGTIAAAREGALNGISSVALSVGSHEASEFSYIIKLIPELMEMADKVDRGVLVSANSPDFPPEEIKGYKVVEAAPFGYGEDYYFERVGKDEFQMTASVASLNDEMKYDFDWLVEGYVAVSPIPTSMTDHESLEKMKK